LNESKNELIHFLINQMSEITLAAMTSGFVKNEFTENID